MRDKNTHNENQQAFRRLRPTIDATYAKGRFVGIADGQIVADAATLDELIAALKAQGRDPRKSMAVQAGEHLPEYVTIFRLG